MSNIPWPSTVTPVRQIPEESRVWFAEEVKPYRVRAAGTRYLVCTKPFNLKATVLYTVVDQFKQVRGTENLIFGMGAESDEHCRAMLRRLETGQTEVSSRNWVDLKITRLDTAAAQESPSKQVLTSVYL